MKILSSRRAAALLAVAVLVAFVGISNRAMAQGPGGGQPPTTGSITAIDKTANTFVVTNDQSGENTTVAIVDTSQIITQVTIKKTDLKVGDQVRIQGVPLGITASSITVGAPPRPGGGPGGPGGPGGGPGRPGGPGGPGGGPGGPGGGPGGQPATAVANGTVKSVTPLTISLGNGLSLNVALDSTSKVTKFTKISLSDLKVGDKILAMGDPGDDGVLNATMVGVNLPTTGRGFGGGFGGGYGGRRRGGGGGFGGGGFGGGAAQ